MNSGMNSPGAAAASCNMKDSGGMKKLIAHTVFSYPPAIFHVAAGRSCVSAVHVAFLVATENDTFENTNTNVVIISFAT